MDEKLSMEKCINTICQSCYIQLKGLWRIRKCLSTNAAKALVHGLITSRLDYCNSLLYGLPRKLITKLQRIQNACARFITYTPQFDHITPVLASLHWLPIQRRIQFKILLLTVKATIGQAPQHMQDMIKFRQCNVITRSTNSRALCTPKISTKTYGGRTFKFASSHLWNNLPLNVKCSTSIHQFRTSLKTHLFSLEFH